MMSWGQRGEAGAGKRLVFEEEMAHNLCSRGELSRPRTGVEQSRLFEDQREDLCGWSIVSVGVGGQQQQSEQGLMIASTPWGVLLAPAHHLFRPLSLGKLDP